MRMSERVWKWTGETLRAALDRHSMTPAELAHAMGLHRQQINKWLRGERPRVDKLWQMCEAIGCVGDELLGRGEFASE